MPRVIRFAFVGNQSRSKRHARMEPSTEPGDAKRVFLCHPCESKPEKSRADKLLGQCSLFQGQAATVTCLKTEPAMHGLEVKTDTPPTPPPPTPSTASATPRPPPLLPILTRTSRPP
ncbi:hypothetical protein QL285_064132 [Trifolium repens]|nr:hypothetical protein QL285_064132 [Trifolium repens]